jgi:superfamily II DNA or RNA helicase
MNALFEAIRSECSKQTWSRGVKLARAGAVAFEEGSDEIVMRVAAPGRLVAPCVELRPQESRWECDCRSLDDPCEHVAAAVIALRRAERQGDSVPQGHRTGGTLGYRLRRAAGGLEFERVVVTGDSERRLPGTLAALASGRVDGPTVMASEADVEVERVLGPRLRGTLPPGILRRLLPLLASCSDIRLDGAPLRADPEAVTPIARVDDAPEGFCIRVEPRVEVTERLADGIVLCGDTMRPLAPSGLTGRELADYAEGLVVPHGEAARLVSELLPALSDRLPVEVRTKRLPRAQAEPPRVRLEVEREDDALSVLATIVYGDPPCARVDAGRFVHLRGAVPLRDENREARLLRHLRSVLGLTPGVRVHVTGEQALSLAARLRQWGDRLEGTAHEAFYQTEPLEPRLRVEGDGFDLTFEVPADAGPSGNRAPTERVLRAFFAGESLVTLDGGGLAPLPRDLLERCGERLAALLEARGEGGRVPPALLPDLAAVCEETGEPPPPGFQRLRALLDGFESLPEARLPEDLGAQLRPYQRSGVDWLAFHREAGLGALLADDMGLGKTLQALCAIRGRSLVVCPTSVLVAWTGEARRFRPALRVSLYHGPTRRLDPEADVTLTTYALLRGDAEILAAQPWDSIVLDEAQAIKNPTSQVARAAHGLQADFRMILTGTPVENRLSELWSLFRFLEPGLLGTRRAFEERTARPVAAGDEAAIARLRARLAPFLLRRLKSQVARELPPRTEVVLNCELSETERSVYDAVRAATRRDVVEHLGTDASILQALEALLRLRQAACHPGLVPGQQAESSSKLELLVETLECAMAEGHRALVFSQWTKLLDLVEPLLQAAGIGFDRLDGTTRDRAGVVERFQDEAGPPVLLVSLRAGGSGLTLTAADHVFLLDPWWNPAVEDQAADRAHRIGQERPVLVHRLVARNTVEERILALQESKRSLFEAALGGIGPSAGISREELLALLE